MKKVIIADIVSLKKDNKIFGHYGKVATMYHELLKEKADVYIAGGPVYEKQFKSLNNIIRLNYDTPIGNHSKFKKMKYKYFSVINGVNLINNSTDSIIIFQPYSIVVISLVLIFSNISNNKIYLISYKNELNSKFKKWIFKLIKSKVSGIIHSQKKLSTYYQLPSIVVPDYIYTNQNIVTVTDIPQYDFGVVGIMSEGKDIEGVIKRFSNTDYKVLIAGFFEDKTRFNKLNQIKTDNITIIDKYLDDKEYEKCISNIKYIILPYKDYYKNATSGVIYDILFKMKPVIAPNYDVFKFIEENEIGVLYSNSIENLDISTSFLNIRSVDEINNHLLNYLENNKNNSNKIINFIGL